MLSFILEVVKVSRHLARITYNFMPGKGLYSTDGARVALPYRWALNLLHMMILFAHIWDFRHKFNHFLIVLRLFLSNCR